MEPIAVSELQLVKRLARIDAEILASARLGRGGPLHLDGERRACLQALSQPFLDRYFALVRRRNVPAVLIAAQAVCRPCRLPLPEALKARLRDGGIAACPRCERLLVSAS